MMPYRIRPTERRMNRVTIYFTLLAIAVMLILASCTTTENARTTLPPQEDLLESDAIEPAGYTAEQASSHVSEHTTVCGTVADSNYASNSNGRPTFLNLDEPYPRHRFTVVIWGSERFRFPNSPESFYRNKEVCATGLIELYQGKAQIVVRRESELVVQ
jgi:hypothetical protein